MVETEVIKELEAEPDDSQFQNPKPKTKTTTQISKFIGRVVIDKFGSFFIIQTKS